jgi:hypothetical protein
MACKAGLEVVMDQCSAIEMPRQGVGEVGWDGWGDYAVLGDVKATSLCEARSGRLDPAYYCEK